MLKRLYPRALFLLPLQAALMMTACTAHQTRSARATPPTAYTAYVANEASDLVDRVVFTPGAGLTLQKSIGIGQPGHIVGPHGLVTSPDGRFWFVTLAHGIPTGSVVKYSSASDTMIAHVSVGAFPETVAITPDGQYLFIANNDMNARDGAPGVSGVSIIFAATSWWRSTHDRSASRIVSVSLRAQSVRSTQMRAAVRAAAHAVPRPEAAGLHGSNPARARMRGSFTSHAPVADRSSRSMQRRGR
jgi:hypothetical protein